MSSEDDIPSNGAVTSGGVAAYVDDSLDVNVLEGIIYA